jgi:hypothetical protein
MLGVMCDSSIIRDLHVLIELMKLKCKTRHFKFSCAEENYFVVDQSRMGWKMKVMVMTYR